MSCIFLSYTAKGKNVNCKISAVDISNVRRISWMFITTILVGNAIMNGKTEFYETVFVLSDN